MATENITLNGDLYQRFAHAVEMATEIKDENPRQYCLASALTDHVDEHTTARGLAEVLESRLSDTDQLNRLITCLQEIQKEVCHG